MSEPQWPPRSPAEALLSSPGGRQRFRDLKEQRRQQRDTSPSPTKKNTLVENMNFLEDEEDEEDEETLQLQLQAIQAKLKLKKLQARKAGKAGAEEEYNVDRSESSELGREQVLGQDNSQPSSRTGSALLVAGPGPADARRRNPEPTGKGLLRSRSVAELVSIPVSPAKRRPIPPADPQRSPARVLLGVDKGRSAADVSLRRPPRAGTTAESLRNTTTGIASRGSTAEKPGKSFNERMAERREQEKENLMKKARSESLRQSRSTGFGVASEELEAYKRNAGEAKVPENRGDTATLKTAAFSREEIMNAARSPHKAVHKNFDRRNHMASSASGRGSDSEKPTTRDRPGSSFLKSKSMEFGRKQRTPDQDDDRPQSSQSEDISLFEPISSTPLSRRILPQSFLERTLKDKKNVPLTVMLRTIKAPDWELPEDISPSDSDFIVFAIIGSKSAPLDHRGTAHSHDDTRDSNQTSTDAAAEATLNNQKKYMVFTLVSPCLRWSIDMYLFGTGYTRWRMLTPGTLIALLNPGIMPPPPGKADTNRWSLRLGSSDDTILEIGTSSELGWCKAMKKNGQRCGAWIDARTLEFCEFHIELNVERIKSTRMDAQGQGGFKKGARGGAGGTGRWGGAGGKNKDKKEGVSDIKFDRFTGTNYYVSSGTGNGGGGSGNARDPFFGGSTSASLLDLDENGASDRTSKAERLRKSLAQREKERDLARELGKSGRGAGAEYMTRHGGERTDTSSNRRRGDREGEAKPLDAKELGLHGGSAADVLLSPLKRKKSALDGIGDRASKRKKTRFVTDKGIKVAGRESLPNAQGGEEDSDDLEIV